jgi:hypothetical protein
MSVQAEFNRIPPSPAEAEVLQDRSLARAQAIEQLAGPVDRSGLGFVLLQFVAALAISATFSFNPSDPIATWGRAGLLGLGVFGAMLAWHQFFVVRQMRKRMDALQTLVRDLEQKLG